MLNLTKEERQVTVFLLSACFCGLAVSYWRKINFQPRFLTAFAQNSGKINLNKADLAVLKSVSGIGDKTASRILEYRRKNIRFNDLSELAAIPGLAKARLEKIKSSFYVD